MSEVKLNLQDKSVLFKVVAFISKIEVSDELANKLSDIDFEDGADDAASIFSFIQILGGTFVEIEDELDILLADLAGVEVREIKSLGLAEYVDVLASFFQADATKQAVKSLKSLRG